MSCFGGGAQQAPAAADGQGQELAKKGGDPLPLGTFEINQNRGCTDILFLLIYIIFWGLMLLVGIVGFVNGNPALLAYGYDFNGNVCGQGNHSDKPNLYYVNPFPNASNSGNIDLSWAVCLKGCPYNFRTPPDMCTFAFGVEYNSKVITCGGNSDGSTNMDQFSVLDRVAYNGYKKYCLGRVPLCLCGSNVSASCCNGQNPQQVINGIPQTVVNTGAEAQLAGFTMGYSYGYCFYTYPTLAVSGLSRCLPAPPGMTGKNGSVTVNFGNVLSATSNSSTASTRNMTNATLESAFKSVLGAASNPQETFTSLVNEVYVNKWLIIGSAGLALLLSLLYTQLLRLVARPFTYVILIALWLLLCAASVILAIKAGLIRPDQVPAVVANSAEAVTLPSGVAYSQAQTNQNLVAIAAAVVGTTFLIYTVLLCVFFPRISVAITVVEEAGECLSAMPLALVFPAAQWVAFCCLFVWWVAVLIYLTSSGSWDPATHTFSWNDTIRRSLIFHCFGLLWARAMILAVGNLIIAGAAAQWYVSQDKQVLSSPMLSSTNRTCRYHLGTAAFGSFIIAVVQFIRWVFRYYMYQLSKMDPKNRLVQALNCIGECCLACLERFLNFINKNAYIQTSITGASFCPAAVAGFNLLLRNFLRVGALTVIASIYLNVGKLFIAGATGFICALIVVGGDMNGIAQAPLFSITIIMLLAFGVASAFMDVWEMVIETVFQCFCMDQEMGGGTPTKATSRLNDFVANNPPPAADVKSMTSTVRVDKSAAAAAPAAAPAAPPAPPAGNV